MQRHLRFTQPPVEDREVQRDIDAGIKKKKKKKSREKSNQKYDEEKRISEKCR